MVKLFRDTVTLSDIWVSSHERLSDFYASSWQRGESAVPMLLVRLVLASAALGILIFSLVEENLSHWAIYLTHWGLVLISAMLLSGLLVSFLAVCGKIKDDTEVPWYIGIYWFLFNQSVTIAIMITVLYWILLYNPESHEDRLGAWLDISTHAFNSCVVLLELLVSRTPVRFLHFYQPLGFGLWYTAFTAIYYAAGGTDAAGSPYIYEVLDWREGRRAGAVVGLCVAGLLAVYSVLWAAAQARDKISTTVVRTVSHNLPPTPPDNFMHARMV